MEHGVAWRKLIKDICDEAVSPVVEIIGNGRVLIEHHKGIEIYQADCVCVRMAYGTVKILGRNLYFAQISPQQLVISGKIESVCLAGGDQNHSVEKCYS